MNPAVVRTLCRAAYHSGLLRAAAGVAESSGMHAARRSFQILVYHRVGPDGDAFVPAAPVEAFARHMRYVSRHLRVHTLTDLLRAAECGDVPPRAIAVTFDDGYEDTY